MKLANYDDKFIRIEHLTSIKKTEVYEVISKCSNDRIGIIHWYPRWRHYTYEPEIEYYTELSDRCLFALGSFINKLNEEHKNQHNKKD